MGPSRSSPLLHASTKNRPTYPIHDTQVLHGPAMSRPPSGHRAESGAQNRTVGESEPDQGGSPRQAHGPSEPLHTSERRRSTDEGSHRAYDIPLLTRAFEWPSPERDDPPPGFPPRLSPGDEPPLTPTTNPSRGPGPVRSHDGKHRETGERRTDLMLGQRGVNVIGCCPTRMHSTADTALRRCTGGTTGTGACRLGRCRRRGHMGRGARRGLCCRR